MTRPGSHGSRPRDYGFLAIVMLVVVTAGWVLLMPWVPAIAGASLNRFHLRTPSFVVWAIQFPIPSMYNFANRVEIREFPPGLLDPIIDVPEKRYINHFPVRVLTFADGRYRHLGKGDDCWVTVDSSYRGQKLESRFHAKAKRGGGFELLRLPQLDGLGE